MELEVLSRKLVSPSSPTQPHLRTFTLSSLDHTQPSFLYATHIFYYPFNVDEDDDRDDEIIINSRREKLEESLSEILTIYYPLAGRFLDQEKLVITCNDQGAEYVEARVVNNVELAQLPLLCGRGSSSLAAAELLHLLVPPSPLTNSAPLLLVQVTMFGCGGLTVGVRDSHRVADGNSMAMFINGWAMASRLGLSQVAVIPSFDLPAIFPVRDRTFVCSFKKPGGANFLTKRFVFDKAAIQNLKQHIVNEDEGSEGVSRVVLVTAFIWRSLIRATQAKHNCVRSSSLCIPFNMRGRTPLVPIPEHSFGNFISHVFVRFVPTTSTNDEPPNFLDLVNILKSKFKEKVEQCTRVQNIDEIVSMVVDSNIERWEEAAREDNVDVYGYTSWCRFPFHEVDFGWGHPTWMSSTTISAPVVRLIDAADGDGIEVWIDLPADEMHLFQQDRYIVDFNKEHP